MKYDDNLSVVVGGGSMWSTVTTTANVASNTIASASDDRVDELEKRIEVLEQIILSLRMDKMTNI